MRAGRLDRRIELLRRATVRGDFGETETVWQLIAPVWAGRDPLKGQERWAAQQAVSKALDRWRIRWRPDIGPESAPLLAVRYRGIDYQVESVEEIGRREGWWLTVGAVIDGIELEAVNG